MAGKKVALVTGCTTGSIGFAYCQSLLQREYIVYATSRSGRSIEINHSQAIILDLDITNDLQVSETVRRIIEEQGQIDLLINNAGVLAPGPIIDFTVEEMKKIYDTNVFSILRLSRAVIPHMAKRKEGIIINMGSVVGQFPTPWMGIYDSSKAAVRIFSEVLSLECRPFNIKVVLIEPASIKSTMLARFDHYKLPEGSLYMGFTHNIRERLDAAQEPGSTPPDVFAETVVGKVLKNPNNPPRYILTGHKATMFRVLALLPRGMYLNIIWKMFSRHQNKHRGQ